MTVSVIDGKCCGYGICAEICPSVYKLDDQGFVVIEGGAVPAELEDDALEGADSCPENAILVTRG
jgi:ferredoxin